MVQNILKQSKAIRFRNILGRNPGPLSLASRLWRYLLKDLRATPNEDLLTYDNRFPGIFTSETHGYVSVKIVRKI